MTEEDVVSNLEVKPFQPGFALKTELEFVLGDGDECSLCVHPWIRGKDRSVFISLAGNGSDKSYGDAIIVDRDEFVEGLIAVFPELMKKEGYMKQSEVNEIARKLILNEVPDYDFSLVYDHEDADGWGEDNWIRIHDAMRSATVSVSFDNEED